MSELLPEQSLPGWICEVFTSIQGEGLYCGQRQTFVRFAGCNLFCAYCDTPPSRDPRPAACGVETAPGAGSFDELPNPLDSKTVTDACLRLGAEMVALTGGEPLLQVDFLGRLMCDLRNAGMGTYLETNGTLHEALPAVVQYADVIAMDIKLESATGCATDWDAHLRFLETAAFAEVFVKTVVSSATTSEEMARCIDLIAVTDPRIPLIIQPVTGTGTVPGTLLFRLQDTALERLADVRVIPQCHKMLGVL